VKQSISDGTSNLVNATGDIAALVHLLIEIGNNILVVITAAGQRLQFSISIIPLVLWRCFYVFSLTAEPLEAAESLYFEHRAQIKSTRDEIVNGSATLRAFDKVEVYLEKHTRMVDNYQHICAMGLSMFMWMSFQIKNLFLLFSLLVCLAVVYNEREDVITQSLTFSLVLGFGDLATMILCFFNGLRIKTMEVLRCMRLLEVP